MRRDAPSRRKIRRTAKDMVPAAAEQHLAKALLCGAIPFNRGLDEGITATTLGYGFRS
jgi:hypothetical protein